MIIIIDDSPEDRKKAEKYIGRALPNVPIEDFRTADEFFEKFLKPRFTANPNVDFRKLISVIVSDIYILKSYRSIEELIPQLEGESKPTLFFRKSVKTYVKDVPLIAFSWFAGRFQEVLDEHLSQEDKSKINPKYIRIINTEMTNVFLKLNEARVEIVAKKSTARNDPDAGFKNLADKVAFLYKRAEID